MISIDARGDTFKHYGKIANRVTIVGIVLGFVIATVLDKE